jgi:hypothetical protein
MNTSLFIAKGIAYSSVGAWETSYSTVRQAWLNAICGNLRVASSLFQSRQGDKHAPAAARNILLQDV